MSKFLVFVFIFFMGSIFGWILEILFRRIVHKKWVNPGFLVGPYLPIYGFGLCTLSYCYIFFKEFNLSPIIAIIIMGVMMTLIELIGGLFFIKTTGVKLWDYSNEWGNYKGIICPLFSAIWTILGAVYYYFIAPYIMSALEWFSNNLSFSFVLGIFFGIIVLDFIYSTKLLVKIRKFAKDNELEVKYEELKLEIKERQKKLREKYSFLFAFRQTLPLKDYLDKYLEKRK